MQHVNEGLVVTREFIQYLKKAERVAFYFQANEDRPSWSAEDARHSNLPYSVRWE